MARQQEHSIADIAEHIAASVSSGDSTKLIRRASGLQAASPDAISFIADQRYLPHLLASNAGAIICTKELAAKCSKHACVLVVSEPMQAWLKLLYLFAKPDSAITGSIHPTAIVPDSCHIAPKVSIGPYVVLGERVTIATGTTVAAHCSLADDVTLGENCHLYPRVTLYSDVQCGKRCIFHAGVVLGADGFGNVRDRQAHWQKIQQLGGLRIGNDVEIGANTTIDCGALEDSIIEDGVKIDNMVYAAHNVNIGAHTAIAAGTIIAGTVKIGKHCIIAGGCAINGHISICDKVTLTATTSVSKSIYQSGVYSSGSPAQAHHCWKKSEVHYRNLDKIVKRLKNLEKQYD